MSPFIHQTDKNRELYKNYYLNQAGDGLSVFSGASTQRGHGLGSIFGSIAKLAAPLVRRGVNVLGKQALRSGVRLAGDVIEGRSPKQALKRRGIQFVNRTASQLLSPPGEPMKKRAKRTTQPSLRKKRGEKRHRDIFS